MTYQYFQFIAERDGIGKAIEAAISAEQGSECYRAAQVAEDYFNKRNRTIMEFRKMLNTVSGGKIEDIYSANYKVRTLWYRLGVTQILNYLLGNGVDFDTDIKDELGRKFDTVIYEAAKGAANHGRCFTFWNQDHAEVFQYLNTAQKAGFVPLYDKASGELAAGIRYWYEADEESGGKSYLACTLYEGDGLTDFDTDRNSKELVIVSEKRGYIATTSTNGLGVSSTVYSNPDSFPIKELYFNSEKMPLLVGHRETIDTHDLMLNGFANTVDDTAEIFWVLKSFGGEGGELDLAKVRSHLKRLHMASINTDGEDIEPHTINIPTEAREAVLNRLRKAFFEGFMLADMDSLSAAQKTTQEIQAAFTAQDNFASELEFAIIDHIQDILAVAGMEGEPFFRRNRIQNITEAVQAVAIEAQYLPPDMIPKLLPNLTPEQAAEAAQYMLDMDASRLVNTSAEGGGEGENAPGVGDE